MSGHSSNICPKCGTPMNSSGFDSHVNHGAAHLGMHGLQHGNPFMLIAGVGIALARAAFPKKFTCPKCGYSVRD